MRAPTWQHSVLCSPLIAVAGRYGRSARVLRTHCSSGRRHSYPGRRTAQHPAGTETEIHIHAARTPVPTFQPVLRMVRGAPVLLACGRCRGCKESLETGPGPEDARANRAEWLIRRAPVRVQVWHWTGRSLLLGVEA